MYNYLYFFIWLIIVVIYILYKYNKRKYAQIKRVPPFQKKVRPVIMIMIDSLMTPPLQEAIRQNKAPALAFLIEKGALYPHLVTTFPTMSVTIDSTLLTGATPNQHQIFGLCYFHREEQRMINLGTGPLETIAFGIKRVLRDSIEKLNQQLLSKDTQTIHEEALGPTASINGLIYRGKVEHTMRPPLLATLLGFLPRKVKTKGPDILSFGSLAKFDPDTTYDQLIFRSGINNKFSRMELISLIKNDRLPSFTLVYLSDNDQVVHRKGPATIKGIEKADQELAKIFNTYPSWDEAIEQAIWIVMGDSGQTGMVSDQEKMYVDLRKLLSNYRIMPLKRDKPISSDQIVICANERMAYIHVVDPTIPMPEIRKVFRREPRIDLIAWFEDDWIHVESGQQEGHFQYRPSGEYVDEYQQTWQIQGDPSLMDLTIDDEKLIQYGNYPDVLSRLAGVIEVGERVIILTVLPGYEMIAESTPKHKGACHGSLHYLDSVVPMIVCGTDQKPDFLRIIDLKKWIVQLITPKT